MRIILSSLLFFIFSNFLFSQYQVKGKVLDENGLGLSFASVFLKSTEHAALTNEEGEFLFENVARGEYQIVATFLGYKKYQESIFVDKDLDYNFEMAAQAFDLGLVEIKGTWAGEKYPFAKVDLNSEELEERNAAMDAPYLLQYTPSVVVSSDAGAGVGYTGIRIRGVDPTRINVTVNGIPWNDSESQSLYWVDLPDIMSSVNDVQIQRGVGTSTNGSAAFGASINLNTNRIKMQNYANIDLGYGSFNTSKIGVELGTGLMNDKYTLDGRYTLINSDGYIDRAESALNSIYLSGARITENQSFRFNYFTGHEITYQAWNGLPAQYWNADTLLTYNISGRDDDFSRDDPYENEVDNYKQGHYQFFWNRKLNDAFNMDLGLHYTRGKGFYENFKYDDASDYGLTSQNEKDELIRRKWLDNHFYGMIYNISKSFDQSQLILGGGLHNYLGRHFGEIDTILTADVPIDPGYTYYDNDAQKLDFNTYLKYQHSFGQLNAFADLQYRRVNYQFEGIDDDGKILDQSVKHNFFNPKAGLFYSLGSYSNAFISFAVAHREPNRDDYTQNALENRPKAERLMDYEAGFRLGNESLSFASTFYFMDYKDHLVLTGKLNDVGDYTKINVADSYRRGIELELAGKIQKVFDLGASVSLSENKIASFEEYIDNWDVWGEQIAVQHENTDISFSPSIIAGAELKWHILESLLPVKDQSLDLSFSSKYVGKQYLDNTMNEQSSLDPFFYSDLMLEYALQTGWLKNASLALQVNNLFNASYVSNGWNYRFKSSGYDPVPYDPRVLSQGGGYYNMIGLFPQATRHFMLRLRLNF